MVSAIRPADPNSSLSRSDVNERRNAIKMHAYLLCQFIEIVENDSTAEASAAAAIKVVVFIYNTILQGVFGFSLKSEANEIV